MLKYVWYKTLKNKPERSETDQTKKYSTKSPQVQQKSLTTEAESKIQTDFDVLIAAAAKSLQSCPTLCNPLDSSPPGFPVPGILQARTLEWIAISFSNAWKWKVKVKSLSHVWLFETPWTTACQAPPSRGFSRQDYWSGLPFPSPEMSSLGKAKEWTLFWYEM